MKSLKVAVLVLGASLLTACGTVVEVPTAHVGKISSSDGLQEGVIPPSKLRLNNLCYTCDNIILAEASDRAMLESMMIYMPKDELNLKVDVRAIVTISSDEENINKIFSRVSPKPTESDRVKIVPITDVYNIYAQPVIREAVRSVLAGRSIENVMEHRREVSEELANIIRKDLAGGPINVISIGLADIQPPEVITKAREAAKEREIAIQRAEADKQVKLKEAEAALEVAKKQQEVDLKEAETQVLVNQKLTEGVNQAFVTQRWLKVMEKLAENPEGKVIILPSDAIQDPSLMMGVNNRAISK